MLSSFTWITIVSIWNKIPFSITFFHSMVFAALESPVSGRRLSSVVPAEVTGDNKDFELSNMDLAMKLHYIKGVYFFQSEAVQGVSIENLKEPMFRWLEFYFTTSGRIRRSSGTGRPFIKCNDAGVRIVEAHCDSKTIDEWLETNDHSLDHLLAHDQVLGPDLGFSPLVFLQFTWFKSGGMSIGLSWAHVLGDAFSASAFINLWGQIMAGQVPPKSLQAHNPEKSELPTSISRKPFSLKKVDPVGDSWLTANNHNMQTYSFHVTAKQLHHMVSSTRDPSQTANISHFEILSAIIWNSLSKIREDMGPRIVTICSNNSLIREHEMPTNGMIFSTVEADFSVSKSEISELAKLIAEKRMPENGLIEELLRDEARSDFIVYGANLTFVDLEEANLYGLELKGKRPTFVNYTINGVGDEGTVLILPDPEKGGGSGKIVTMTLPEYQLAKLKNILGNDWDIAKPT